MIVTKNTHPERSLYYLGSVIIEILDSSKSQEYDYMILYEIVAKRHATSISLFALALDWLYIIGVVHKGQKGMVKKCF